MSKIKWALLDIIFYGFIMYFVLYIAYYIASPHINDYIKNTIQNQAEEIHLKIDELKNEAKKAVDK